MLGVILFCLVLLFYGFILSLELFEKVLPQGRDLFIKVKDFTEQGTTKVFLSLGAMIIGIWNFFAPDFGAAFSPTIIGALIPSLLLVLDSTVIYPNILEILNIPQESKQKYYEFVEKYRGMAGILTLAAGFLHMALFRIILF